jgi:3-isopropylmalate dehydrogenase
MNKTIAVLPGDGIGEEVMAQALRVLEAVSTNFDHKFELKHGKVGGAAYEKHKTHFPDATKDLCKTSDAILFGSVGGPVKDMHLEKWKGCEANSILAIRKAFGFNANFRPIKIYPQLGEISPLRQDLIERGIDILFIRELLGDCYFGEHKTTTKDGLRFASDISEYNEEQISSVAHIAFKAAQKRRKKVTSVDKANVLDTSKLWRTVVHEIGREYPDVELEDMLVDNCAMQIIRDPSHFDVVVLSNMFGDILSDAAAVLPGSLGLLCSASFNKEGFALYEPPGGSAQDIAGQSIANPIAQILSVGMLLRFSFGLEAEAKAIEVAIETALSSGCRTRDIYRGKGELVGSKEMTDAILANLPKKAAAVGSKGLVQR